MHALETLFSFLRAGGRADRPSNYRLHYVVRTTLLANQNTYMNVYIKSTASYGGTYVTCVCFYLSRVHDILSRVYELLGMSCARVKKTHHTNVTTVRPYVTIGVNDLTDTCRLS